MAHSTDGAKPKKPRADFPLFPHATGRWAKKVRGKLRYFGRIEGDPKGVAAEKLWDAQKADLLAGRVPRVNSDGLTVHKLCNLFCASKELQCDAGSITAVTVKDCVVCCRRLLSVVGKERLVSDLAPADFADLRNKLTKRYSPIVMGKTIQGIRSLFKWASEAEIIDKPARFGPTFKRPDRKTLRKARQAKGPRMFEPRHVRRMLKTADQPLRAMILLGVNCGFGNSDCGRLPKSAIDLRRGWIDFPRPKTAVERRCPLWPETIAALKDAIANRPEPKDPLKNPHDDGLAFLTKYGQSWAKETSDNPISNEMRKLLDKLEVHRPGLGFYTLRHVFETIAGASRDQVAVDAIMGHDNGSMAGVYREAIDDQRLIDAAGCVRRWLFRRTSKAPWRSRRPRSNPGKSRK